MQKYSDVVFNVRGVPVQGASVMVTTYPAGATATIYLTDGGAPTTGAMTTDQYGGFSFYAADGHYTITISGAGLTPTTKTDVLLRDVIGQNLYGEDHYPYAVSFTQPAPTASLTMVLPPFVAQFYHSQISVPQTSIVAPASRVVDVWLTPAGTYVVESEGLLDYGLLPRHEAYLHVYRVQTSDTKIQGFYPRFATVPVYKHSAVRPFGVSHFANNMVIPSTYVAWVDNSAAVKGTVYRSASGDLWQCEDAGVCSSAPSPPVYTADLNSGFGIVQSGSANFTFRGRSSYKDVWRTSPRGGIQWYFGNIAAGLMADRLPEQAKAYLKAAAFHVVDNWFATAHYKEGHKVAGAATSGSVWEAVNDGTAGGTSAFPAAAVGDTYTDNDIVWRCLGAYTATSQKLFWYDTDPTMRSARSPDSHDSYAATFVWAVWRYMQANPTDTAWLSDVTTHPGGYTFLALIKEIVYYNLLIQINGEGLTNTFQGNFVPFGGTYSASFFMDNCEVWAGFQAGSRLFESTGDHTYATTLASYRDNLATALDGLWEPETGAYKYVYGLPSMAPAVPGEALFYPLCMSQAWGALWGVPLPLNRLDSCFEYMAANYPQWWARNDIDDLLAIGAHYGYAAHSGNIAVREAVLSRVETERLRVGQADIYVMDAAYYISLRSNQITNNLSALL